MHVQHSPRAPRQTTQTQKACNPQPGRHTRSVQRMHCGSLGHNALSTDTIRAMHACESIRRLACAWVRMLPGNATTCTQQRSKHKPKRNGSLSSHCNWPYGRNTPNLNPNTTTTKTQNTGRTKLLCQVPHPKQGSCRPAAATVKQNQNACQSVLLHECAACLGRAGHDCALLPQHTSQGSTEATDRLHIACCRLRVEATATCFTRAARRCLLSCRQQLHSACCALTSCML